MKDPVGLRYYRLLPIQHRLLELLDGTATWNSIYERLRREFRDQRITSDGLRQLMVDLHRKELILSTQPGQSDEIIDRRRRNRRERLKRLPMSLLFIRLPGWNADAVLRWLTPLAGPLYSPAGLILSGSAVAAAWLSLLVHFDEFQIQLLSGGHLFGLRNILVLWLAIGAVKALHELSHAVACRRLGGECHEIGLAFLLFSPCLYCDVSDSWMMQRKRHRIAVALAGIWIELILSAVCVVLWWNTGPGLIHSLCLQLIVVTSFSTILFNANPLLRYDGYYVLADWLEIPNLQQRGQQAVRRMVARGVFGVELPEDPFCVPERFTLHLTYGICSGLYRWLILFGIGWFLYEFLRPWGLQNLALIYVLLSVTAWVASMGVMFWRITMHMRHSRMSAWLRWFAGAAAVGVVILSFWHFPLRDHATAAVLVEPHGLQHVYAELPGQMREIAVSVGDHVEAGQTIARLENDEETHRLIELAGEQRKRSAELAMARATSNPDLGTLISQEIRTLSHHEQAVKDRHKRLLISAPCRGQIVSTAERLNGPSAANGADSAAENHLLSPENVDALIQRRTHLCSIAPDDRWQAVAWIDQDEEQYLNAGGTVEVMLSAYPGVRIPGRIESIAPADNSQIPAPLAARYGGEMLTRTTKSGETPLSATYRVVILLSPTERRLCLNMQGRVRFVRAEQSVGDWLMHVIRRSFLAL